VLLAAGEEEAAFVREARDRLAVAAQLADALRVRGPDLQPLSLASCPGMRRCKARWITKRSFTSHAQPVYAYGELALSRSLQHLHALRAAADKRKQGVRALIVQSLPPEHSSRRSATKHKHRISGLDAAAGTMLAACSPCCPPIAPPVASPQLGAAAAGPAASALPHADEPCAGQRLMSSGRKPEAPMVARTSQIARVPS
jgi:hypothetical protein